MTMGRNMMWDSLQSGRRKPDCYLPPAITFTLNLLHCEAHEARDEINRAGVRDQGADEQMIDGLSAASTLIITLDTFFVSATNLRHSGSHWHHSCETRQHEMMSG